MSRSSSFPSLTRARVRLLDRLRGRHRRDEGRFLVEGVRACEELLDHPGIEFVLHSPRLETTERGEELLARLQASELAVVAVSDAELDAFSDTETPQGIMAVCAEPQWTIESFFSAVPGPIVLFDGIQDPGNVGTLVRAATAFGVTGIVALEGTADPWAPKVVRAAAGALLRIPILRAAPEPVRERLLAEGIPLLVAEPEGKDVSEVMPSDRWALVLGNEGAGVRELFEESATERVSIPMPGGGDSLNVGVAGSILLYALTRVDER